MDEGFKKLVETERSLDNRELIRRVKSGQREGQIHGREGGRDSSQHNRDNIVRCLGEEPETTWWK